MNKKLILSILILLLSISPVLSKEPTDYNNIKVIKVIDGDTFKLENRENVRLIGIDCPESRVNAKAKKDSKGTAQDLKTITKMGKEATKFVKELVEGKYVKIQFDVERKDRYERLLAYMYLQDGSFLNASIVKSGYASPMTIPPNVKYADLFQKLYQEARENKRGLWK